MGVSGSGPCGQAKLGSAVSELGAGCGSLSGGPLAALCEKSLGPPVRNLSEDFRRLQLERVPFCEKEGFSKKCWSLGATDSRAYLSGTLEFRQKREDSRASFATLEYRR